MTTYYEAGDVIIYDVPGGGSGKVLVIARVDNLINGGPGCVGVRTDGSEPPGAAARTWVLDAEITGVASPPAREPLPTPPDLPDDEAALGAYCGALPAPVVRSLADGMPYRGEARKAELVAWLTRYEPGRVREHRARSGDGPSAS